jgi:multiple sugar transport system permease protein
MRKQTKARRVLDITGFFAPALLLMVSFYLGPMILTAVFSFTNMSLTGSAARTLQFVGFRNFVTLFSDPKFYDALRRTVIFIIASGLVGQQFFGFTIAYMMRGRNNIFRKFVGFPIMMGWCCPMVVAAFIFLAFFEDKGTFNKILGLFRIGPTTWLYSFPMTCIVFASIWKGTAYCMMMYQAALDNVSDEITDAARIDGANGFQLLIRIIIPILKDTIGTVSMIVTLTGISAYGLVYAMLKGGPNNSTTLLSIYMYKQAFVSYQLGYGTAIALIMLSLGVIFALIYTSMVKENKSRGVQNEK